MVHYAMELFYTHETSNKTYAANIKPHSICVVLISCKCISMTH